MVLDVKEWSTSEVWHRVNANDLLKDVSEDIPLLQPNLETIEIFAGKLDHLLQKEYINAEEKQEWLEAIDAINTDSQIPWCWSEIQNFDRRYCPPLNIPSSNLSYQGSNIIITEIPYFGTRKVRAKRSLHVNGLLVAIKNRQLVFGILVSSPGIDMTVATWEKVGEKYVFTRNQTQIRKEWVISNLSLRNNRTFAKKTEEILEGMRKTLALNQEVINFAAIGQQLTQSEEQEEREETEVN